MSALIAECQEMKDRLVDGDDVKVSCKKTDDAPEAYAKSDEKHGVADTARATLTDDEREAIEWAAKWITSMVMPSAGLAHAHVDSLRKLLERLK
jgi:hypothetical protein